MQHDQQRQATVGHAGDERRRPQRAVPRKRLAHDVRHQVEERPLVPGPGTMHPADVPADVEARVVHSEGAATAQRRPDQSLA